MIKVLKALWAPVAALVGVLVYSLTRSHDDKGDVQQANDRATAARVDAINAKADLDKEKIHNETQQDLADADALSDADIIADALDGYRGRNGGRIGVQGSDTDD